MSNLKKTTEKATEKTKEKLSVSKKGLAIMFGSAILLTIIIVLLTILRAYDLTVIGEVCTALWGAVGAYSAFYLWKSKVENRHKFAQAWVSEMADKYGIENITPIIQSILED